MTVKQPFLLVFSATWIIAALGPWKFIPEGYGEATEQPIGGKNSFCRYRICFAFALVCVADTPALKRTRTR